jgi:putative hemolysin
MLHLWQALAGYVDARQIAVLFGVASFHGTDAQALSAPLSLLYHKHLAPKGLRVTAKGPTAVPMNIQPLDTIDRIAAVRGVPALIKAYLRLGGKVAPDAFVDYAFNTVDICLILEKDAIDGLQRAILAKGGANG